jgi:hypothetical protein
VYMGTVALAVKEPDEGIIPISPRGGGSKQY